MLVCFAAGAAIISPSVCLTGVFDFQGRLLELELEAHDSTVDGCAVVVGLDFAFQGGLEAGIFALEGSDAPPAFKVLAIAFTLSSFSTSLVFATRAASASGGSDFTAVGTA